MKLAKDLVAASSAPLVLSILAEGESYGYAIIQRVRELSGDQMVWTDGMLYPVLHRLETQGAVVARWKLSEAGRRRKYYSLKPAGRKALQEHQVQWNTVHRSLATLWGA
jgi:DNA-binding PadR family transcriptional regulator